MLSISPVLHGLMLNMCLTFGQKNIGLRKPKSIHDNFLQGEANQLIVICSKGFHMFCWFSCVSTASLMQLLFVQLHH